MLAKVMVCLSIIDTAPFIHPVLLAVVSNDTLSTASQTFHSFKTFFIAVAWVIPHPSEIPITPISWGSLRSGELKLTGNDVDLTISLGKETDTKLSFFFFLFEWYSLNSSSNSSKSTISKLGYLFRLDPKMLSDDVPQLIFFA